mgnify:FL=1
MTASTHGCRWMALIVLTAWGLAAPLALQADWPTFRADSRRSGVSTMELKLPLAEAWKHRATHAPSPAWPELPAEKDVWHRIQGLGPTTTFDRAYQVAIADGALCYASSADDTLYCLDAATGERRWSFTTEGPLRLAPTVAAGRLYLGSDDGLLYCLSPAGQLLWKYRGAPADRRLPGNGRMMSLWPVRCGIVVEEGLVYFCAGLFPTQENYLCAIDAASGQERWKQKIDISSQGYLLASAEHLYVPTGRTALHLYQRADGKDGGALPGGGADKRAGGCFAVLLDDMVLHSTGEAAGIHFTTPGSQEKIVFADGLRVVADGQFSYILTKDRLYALDRAHWLELSRLQAKKEKTAADRQRIAALGGTRKDYVKWDVTCPDCHELILVGQTLFAGTLNRVAAFDAADGRQLWMASVDGKAYGLAASDGALYVSTDKGLIHCFRPGTPPRSGPHTIEVPHALAKPSPYPTDAQTPLYEQAAQRAIQRCAVKKGYCLVLGAGTGRLAYEIARRSQLQVVGLEQDPQQVAQARRLLAEAGLYGVRISIHQGTLDQVRYAKHFANLIVSDEALLNGRLLSSAAEVHRLVRPCGGTLVIETPRNVSPDKLAAWGRAAIAGWQVEPTAQGHQAFAARGPVPGAGEWSHFYADPANTACSGDAFPPGPVDIQWFGRPGPRRMPDRHDKNVGPLYKNGRLFVSGDNYVVAVDAYNGTILWERDVPESVRLGAFRHSGSMAASEDRLYMAAGSDCLGLDAQTGKVHLTLSVPPAADGAPREWGYVAVVDDLLLGSATPAGAAFRHQTLDTEVLIWRDFMPVICSHELNAHQIPSGQPRWTYTARQGAIITPTIAAGNGRVYFVESADPQTLQIADGRVKIPLLVGQGTDLVALDLRSGETLWRKAVDLRALQHIVFLSYAQERLVITGSKNVTVDGAQRVRYDLAAFDAASGSPLWQTTQTPVPDHILQGPHGEQVQHSAIVGDAIYNTGFACHLHTGEPIPGWKWQKSGHCGTLSTSAACAFSRYGTARMFDLQSGQHTELTGVVRPGCWINILPAGGLVLMPEASAGCVCGYSIQASVALTPSGE